MVALVIALPLLFFIWDIYALGSLQLVMSQDQADGAQAKATILTILFVVDLYLLLLAIDRLRDVLYDLRLRAELISLRANAVLRSRD